MILLIDNYDSFTYNLYQYLCELGAEVVVHRNDKITLEDVEELSPRGIIISPGPGSPLDAGISNDVVRRFGGQVPTLGVCLGHQCVGYSYGGSRDKRRGDHAREALPDTPRREGRISRGFPTPWRPSATTRWSCPGRTCQPSWR